MTDDQNIDTGEPIAELAELLEPAKVGFFDRLWRRIDRRKLGAEVADLGWNGILTLFVEYLSMMTEIFQDKNPPVPMASESTPDEGENR